MPDINAIPPTAQKAAESMPAAPVREAGAEPATAPTTETDRSADQPAIAAPTPASGLTTYRDEASGLTVVQIFHAATGQVIAQFPSEAQLERYPSAPSDTDGPSLAIDT